MGQGRQAEAEVDYYAAGAVRSWHSGDCDLSGAASGDDMAGLHVPGGGLMETDEDRAQRIVRAVFMDDLKGDVGHLARRSVPLCDRQDIAKRLVVEFRRLRDELRREYTAY